MWLSEINFSFKQRISRNMSGNFGACYILYLYVTGVTVTICLLKYMIVCVHENVRLLNHIILIIVNLIMLPKAILGPATTSACSVLSGNESNYLSKFDQKICYCPIKGPLNTQLCVTWPCIMVHVITVALCNTDAFFFFILLS